MNFFGSSHSRKIGVIISGLIVLYIIICFINGKLFLSEAISALFGLLVGLLLYEFSLVIDEKAEKEKINENTKYVYELYKIEIENNVNHINNMETKRWIPYYRLQTNTRDKLWGELADYSKDIEFMKKINKLYNEYALINNKIDIMIAILLQLYARNARPCEEMSREPTMPEDLKKLNTELFEQLDSSIVLGQNANKIARECLGIIKEKIKP